MKKAELVKAIMALNQGYKKKGLNELKATELTAILEKPQEQKEPEQETPKEQETSAKAPEVPEVPEVPPEEPAEFVSLCGHQFDPSESATCFTMCKNDEPEAYKLCLEHFKTIKVEPKKEKKVSAGMNVWHHAIGSQGGLIDDIFINGETMSLEEICAQVSGTAARVKSHLGHLREDWKLDIQVDKEKRFFWAETCKSEGTPIAGRTAYTGTKARPAFLPN